MADETIGWISTILKSHGCHWRLQDDTGRSKDEDGSRVSRLLWYFLCTSSV
jgi:hypothetical protein